MSCAGSERVESNKGFDCGRNMGEVLGKECEKDKSLTQSVEDLLREETEGAASSRDASESDSDKDELSGPESDEDLSWLLPINTVNLGSGNCKCEGCSKLFESYNSDKENAKLLLSSWKEFRNYIRNIYLKSPFEFTQKNDSTSLKNNEKLHEIIQVMRLCDPYQLFQKIEDELCSMVLQSRVRQLNLLKDESNPALAEEFITGLIAEYVKLLTSALQLSPAIENLLGPQLQKFGLTWEVLNKQLYRSLVYNHFDVQQNLVRFIEQLRKMLPFKDDIYHELVHQYLALDREMTLIGAMWKNVEPLIQEYRNLKSKENEKLNNLLDAMKDFFANKLCTEEDELDEANEKNPCSSPEDGVTFCSKDFMPGGGCPCDDCCLSHLMSCKDILLGMESPVGTNTPSRSRSRSPIKQTESEPKSNSRDGDNSEEQSCECHACTIPPSDLMDCSAAFDQSRIKSNTHGEGFQLYPHIHGTKSEAKDVSDLFGSLQKNADLVYPHLYNLNNHETSCPALSTEAQLSNIVSSQVTQQSQNSNKVVSQCQSLSSETSASEAMKSSSTCINSGKEVSSVNGVNLSAEKLASIKKSIEESRMTEERSKVNDGNSESVTAHKGVLPADKGEKSNGEKPLGKSLNNVKGNGCVISGICGKCCLKHGTNCAKMPGCTKGTGSAHGGKAPVRCGGGKDECVHKTSKSHTCGKTKPEDKKALNKRVLDGEPLSGHEDSCSESSNATSVNTQKDPRHCDCCYCEVFGHGMPSVAPVSRNYQEMRDRLRLRLKMKRSVKCKTLQQVPPTTGQNVDKGGSSQGAKKPGPEGDDLESLLKYIEGGKKDDGKSSKKAAKKARQKQKKQKEKQKTEEEAEKKTLESVKNQVDISVVNNNKRSQNVKQNGQPSKIRLQPSPAPAQQQQQQQQKNQKPQCFNLSGLNSLIEKSDPSEVPKMVTIRRVMAPFSAEPTVTITLKGSTPDKDKVLFMLKNGSEAVPTQANQPSKKSRRKKKKKGNNDYEEEEEVYEPEIESEAEFEYEPPAESKSKRKRRRKKRHQEEEEEDEEEEEEEEEEDMEEGYEEDDDEEIVYETKIKTSSKSKEKPKNSKVSSEQSSSSQKSGKKGTQKEAAGKSKSNKSQTTSDAKANQQPSTKMLNQNVKNNKQTSQNSNSVSEKKNAQNNVKSNGKNSSYSSNSVSNNVSNKSDKKVENTENRNSCGKKSKENNTGKNASGKNGQKKTVNNSTKTNSNSITVNQTSKKEKAQRQVQSQESKTGNGKKQKKESVQSTCDTAKHKQTNSSNSNKTDAKSNGNSNNQTSNKNNKNTSNSNSSEKNKSKEIPGQKTKVQSQKNQGLDILEKLQNKHRLPNLEITRAPDPSERARKAKEVTPPLQEVEVNWKGPSDRYDKGKVVINTPSYRLSEVLSSIAPSPPPKEEINLENLRLPPGITITKIEGPIAKPVKPSVQPSQIQKPAPPIVMSTPMLKPNPQPGNVIVVDTGRLKEVIKENSQMAPSMPTVSNSKKKKKKNKQQEENMTPTIEVPISDSRFGMKVPKNCSPIAKTPMSMLASMDARKMVPNLDNQQATIIKTSNNMVTIRSPALQQAMNIHAYQSSQAYKAGLNGYTNVSLFEMNEKMGNLKLSASMADAEDRLARQMRSLNLKGENRAKTEVLAHANSQVEEISLKKKKKKKKKGKSKDEVEPVESVFQPKDIDLENGDIDDDERELEAFKRFCLQSVPSERKNKVKVNLNLKDIVLKKKSS